MALVMVLSLLPAIVLAGESISVEKISTMEQLTTGQYVLVTSVGYAPGVFDNGWLTATTPTVNGSTIEGASAWTITVDGSTVKLTDSNGVIVAPKGGNNNGIIAGDYSWKVTCTDGTFTFAGQGTDTVVLASNVGSEGKFRAYKNTTVSGNPNGYPCDFSLYKLTGSATDPDPTPTPVDISEALAGSDSTSFTVRGVVTLVDGQNIYVQDATGAICVRMSSTPLDIALGDTIIGTGSKTTYKGLPQLESGTYEKSSGLTLSAKETTIGALTTADICTYVKLTGVEVTEVYDNNGGYTFPNITVTDGTDSIQIYKAVVGKTDGAWDIQVGDVIDVTAAVSCYNTTLQLRNTQASEISKAVPAPTYDTIATALAGENGTSFTVKGVVTLVDGKNIYVQDATGGIDLYFGTAPTDISLGDTLIATGAKAVYNGLPELTSATYEKSSGLTLTAKETTIGALTTADICTYVKLTGVEVTEVYDNNGGYTSPNITVVDGADSIQIYKAVVGKTDGAWDIQVGDVIDVTAAVGVYKTTTLQLRNTQASEINKHEAGPLSDGDKVVIYNPANNKALSTTYSGYYNSGTDVTVTGDTLTGFTAADVWTVGVNADGTYTFSTSEGKKLSMGSGYTSTPLDDVNTSWNVTAAATEGCYYIQNAARGNYLEWYASKDNWSSYTKVSDEALFAQKFYKVTEIPGSTPDTGLPEAGAQVMIYNVSAKGVLSLQDDNETSPSITNAAASVADGKVTAANGGLVFTVEKNGDYYRFKNETFGYLCSNGTGNNAFYSQEASEDADWTLSGQGDGYTMESRTAKFNGKYSQYMEYYAGSYKTYSMYNVTDYDIYTFQFLPCANGNLTGGVVNKPAVDFGVLPNAYVGTDYTFTFTVDAVFGVDGALTVKAGDTVLTANTDGSYTIPAENVTGESLTITVTGKDTKGVAISGTATVTVKDEPVISDLTPAAGSQTGENKRPVISAKIANAGENPTVTMTVGGEAVEAVYAGGVISYTPAADMTDGRTTVTVTVQRADGKEATKSWSFTVGTAQFQLYFGQLHSHTQYSDGSGTLDSALEYVKNLPDSANVDFVAFTDHSNYFDKSGDANPEGALYNMNLATDYSQGIWSEFKGKVAAFNEENSGKLVALGGFEMTWSGGPGHINTWNTPGIVSRNNTTLNNKTSDSGMKAYYALLSQSEGANSISQFNHPGSTFGTFSDFAYWDATIDSRMYLVEVGNGEGAIGAGGYYPSYEYYTMALDKGWHLAPTNNQDNHKGKWGNANDARDVILTDDFSEEGIYEAIRNYRVYATEDKNLAITYTVNGQMLGSQLPTDVETLELAVTVNDPDSTDSIAKVEVIVNSGKVAYTWSDPAELASGELSVTLDPTYSYYFIRVTEKDGDLAVTAPVWVGEVQKLGISSVECGTSTPVTNEELTLTTTLFNSETTGAMVKSITYTAGNEVLGTADLTGKEMIAASSTLAVDFKYTPTVAKVMTITVTAVVEQNGVEYTYTKDIELDVLNADSLVYIGIDASHYNEYVAGNYKDSMGNFGELAAGYSVRTVELKTSDELIAACSNPKYKALILTAPSRRLAAAQSDPKTYSADELAAITAFNANGGVVILAGWSDNYENYSVIQDNKDILHMAATQNAVLEALGSSLRISDDATYDDVRSAADGVDKWRLYFSTYGESFLTDGVIFDAEHPYDKLYTERFSHYGGASVYAVDADGAPTSTLPGTVIPVVYGHESTYSVDVDKDGLGGDAIPKYAYTDSTNRLMVMASEQLEGKGLIIVSGAAFMSNFEVQATVDNGAEKNYSNYRICENLVKYLNPVTTTDIVTVRAQTEAGYKYTIEGVVTSNASGYDKETAFFDCIYIQDATGGICCFPVSGEYKIGDKVRVTGTTDFYQGEPELQVTSIEVIGKGTVAPTEITAAELNDRSAEGKLVTVKGTVESFELANGLVQTIMVKDAAGNVARVFIDGYITTSEDVKDLKVGCKITATGLASYDDTFNAPEGPFTRIRVRDRADIVCTKSTNYVPVTPVKPTNNFPFEDVSKSDYYYDAVKYAWENGLFTGVTDTEFAPGTAMNRGMLATVLYRMANEPDGTFSFDDVFAGDWYFEGVSWAASVGIINGYGDGTFGPKDLVTREQAVAMLYRYCQSMGLDVSARADLSAYPDAETISAYAVEPMQWAVAVGLINGRDTGEIDPTGTATRAELALILMRFCEQVVKK